MTNFNASPNVGIDGETSPSFNKLIAGKDDSGNQQDVLTDSDGHLQVDVLSGGGSGTEYTDDTAFTAASDVGTLLFAAATSDSVDSGDRGVLAMDTSRNLKVSIEADNAGIGGGTQYTEDSVHNSGDTGTLSLVVRNDSLAALAGTDGDYAPLQVNASGALYVDGSDVTQPISAASLPLPSGAATAANQTTIIGHVDGIESLLTTIDSVLDTIKVDTEAIETAVELLDNAISGSEMQVDIVGITPDLMLGTDFSNVFGTASLITSTQADDLANTTDGINTTSLNYVFDGSTWDRMRGDAADGVLVNLGSNNDVTVSSGSVSISSGTVAISGGSVGITGSVSVTGSVVADTELPAISLLADNTSNPVTTSVGTFPHWFDGSTWDRARGDSTNGLLVNLGSNNDVVASNGGTFVVQEDGAALTALQLIDDIVYTDDTSTHSTGNSKGAGVMAVATPSDGSVSSNDIGMLAMSTDRRLHVDAQIVGQDADVTIADGGNSITVDNSDLSTIAGAVSGSELQVDIVTAPEITTNHSISGIADGVKVVTTAGTDVALAGSTTCKKVVIQAQTDNTGLIAVGGTGVDATVATGTGIILLPGAVFEMEIDNLSDVYIDSTVDGEGVRFTYFT